MISYLTNDPLSFLAFAVLALVLVPFAQLVFMGVARLEGYSVPAETVQRNNAALGVRNAAFIVAVVIAFQGIARTQGAGLREGLVSLTLYALLSIAMLVVSRTINDRLILWRIDNNAAVVQQQNLAVAIVEGATYLATAFIAAGAASGADASVLQMLLWFAIGQALLVALAFRWNLTLPTFQQELQTGNHACALALAGVLASSGLALAAAVSGPSNGLASDALNIALFLIVWLVFMDIAIFVAEHVIMPSSRLRSEVMNERNVAAGAIQGAMFVAFTLLYVFITG